MASSHFALSSFPVELRADAQSDVTAEHSETHRGATGAVATVYGAPTSSSRSAEIASATHTLARVSSVCARVSMAGLSVASMLVRLREQRYGRNRGAADYAVCECRFPTFGNRR